MLRLWLSAGLIGKTDGYGPQGARDYFDTTSSATNKIVVDGLYLSGSALFFLLQVGRKGRGESEKSMIDR